MKRLPPEERKNILRQQLMRLRKDWICRYGQWNTDKLLGEFRLLLRKANKPGGLEALGAPEPKPEPVDEQLPLFDRVSA